MKKFSKITSIIVLLAVMLSSLSLVTSAHSSHHTKVGSVLNHTHMTSTGHTKWHNTNANYGGCNWNWAEEDLDHKDWDAKAHATWHEENLLYGRCNWDWAGQISGHENWDDSYHSQWHNDHIGHGCGKYFANNTATATKRFGGCHR